MRLVPSVSQRICCGNTVTGHSCMGVSFVFCHCQSIGRSINPSVFRGRCGGTHRLGTDHSRCSNISQWNAGDVSHHWCEYDFDGGAGDCCTMRPCKARKAALHAGGMSESNGSGYWGNRPRTCTDGSGPGGQPAWQGGRWGHCSADGWLSHAGAFQIHSGQQGLLCSGCSHPSFVGERLRSARS